MKESKSEVLVKEKEIVIPGQILARGLDYLPSNGCYRSNNEIKAKVIGLVRIKDRFIGIIPLAGVYVPKHGDGVIGTINDMQTTFWIVDINSPYDSILQLGEAVGEYVDLNKTDISTYFDVGDVIYAKVLNVTKSKNTTLTMNDYRAKKLITFGSVKSFMKKMKITTKQKNGKRNGEGTFSLFRSLPKSQNRGREIYCKGEDV